MKSGMVVNPEEKSVEVGEFRLNYVKSGKGEFVLMLHGADPRESWKTWQSLFSLADDFTLIVPDMIGFGKSSRPLETPDHKVQARVILEMMERLSVEKAALVGSTWGGQVALEMAIEQPGRVKSMILISSTYDKAQLPKLRNVKRPTLILWAQDDMVTQLKAGYLLRDAMVTSRLEVLEAVAKDPRHDFTIAHKLERYRSGVIIEKIRAFLRDSDSLIREPPEMEPELRGIAFKEE